MTKVYQATHNVCLSTSIFMENGKEIIVAFERGANGGRDGQSRINGCFYTNSPKVQEAIEKDRRYGKDFKLIAIEEDGVAVPVNQKSTETEEKEEQKDEMQEYLEPVESVQNKQQAIEFLAGKEIKLPKTTKNEAVKEFAAKEGYCFPNWN